MVVVLVQLCVRGENNEREIGVRWGGEGGVAGGGGGGAGWRWEKINSHLKEKKKIEREKLYQRHKPDFR